MAKTVRTPKAGNMPALRPVNISWGASIIRGKKHPGQVRPIEDPGPAILLMMLARLELIQVRRRCGYLAAAAAGAFR